MRHIKSFNELNELNAETYRSAANKLKDNHPTRAKELDDYATLVDGGNQTINVSFKDEPIKVSEIIYYPDSREFCDEKINQIYKLNGKTNITDRKSAMKFKKYILNSKFKIEKSFPKEEFDNYRYSVRNRLEKISINDLYTSN